MTIDSLQLLVIRLSNQAHVRWWAHWNMPSQSPWQMALSLRSYDGPLPCDELERLGFAKLIQDGQIYYVIERTNLDGSPFTSTL